MTPNMTEALARFIVETAPDALPEAAFGKAEKAIVDSISCILLGNASEVAEPLMHYLDGLGTQGTRPVLGSNRTADAPTSALINGTYGHSEDFDDVLSMMPAHPSVVILSALFADMPRGFSGKKLLDAYIIGIEVGARIGLAISNAHYRRGWHATGSLAIFSALAALARMKGLDVDTTRRAFGIAASTASGLRRNFGTMTKPFHAGWAAHNAVIAARLAQAGFTAAPDIMEATSGFFSTYGSEQSDMQRGLAALGNPYVLLDPGLALKKYPCIYAVHRPIDALLTLRARLGLTPENTERVTCRVAPGVMRVLIYPRPASGLESKFSMQYILAVGILDGDFGCAAFTDEGAQRPGIAALYDRIEVIEDERMLDGDPHPETRSFGTLGYVEVTARRTDGTEETVRVDKPSGSPQRELSWDDMEAKFHDCAGQAGFGRADAAKAFGAWRDLCAQDDVEDLLTMLTRS